jgi:hypothetical protein
MKSPRLFKIGLILSSGMLLLLVAWRVHTQSCQDAVLLGSGSTRIWVHAHRFGIVVARAKGSQEGSGKWEWRSAPAGASGFGMPWIFQGSKYAGHDYLPGLSAGSGPATAAMGSVSSGAIQVSLVAVAWVWIMLLPLLLMLTLGSNLIWRKHTVTRRQRLGLCIGCGYDLCATPRRCPECGMAAAKEVVDEPLLAAPHPI